jgi:hypothetical protein
MEKKASKTKNSSKMNINSDEEVEDNSTAVNRLEMEKKQPVPNKIKNLDRLYKNLKNEEKDAESLETQKVGQLFNTAIPDENSLVVNWTSAFSENVLKLSLIEKV